MNWQKIFRLRGLNYWILSSALGWNLLAGFALLILGFQVLRIERGGFEIIQILLIIGAFMIAALGGYYAGKIAGDHCHSALALFEYLSGCHPQFRQE